MAEIGYFRTVSGTVLDLALPLTEPYELQLLKHDLVRVNEDGTPYTEEERVKPAVNAPKSEWVGWAVYRGADREDAAAATKQDLIDTYGNGEA
jgi:hypothetical protein